MNKITHAWIPMSGTLVLLALLSIYGPWPTHGMGARPPIVGSPAPDFQLTDLHGHTRNLGQYRGRVVLLNFWATWCKPCTKEMPAMQQAYDRFKDQGLVVVAVNELEDEQRVREHIQKHHHTFEVWLDPDNIVANMYGVVGLPVSVFIDRQGRIQRYVQGGLLTPELIDQAVQPLLVKDEVIAAETAPQS